MESCEEKRAVNKDFFNFYFFIFFFKSVLKKKSVNMGFFSSCANRLVRTFP